MNKVILFDLDGTLVDSAQGIITSFQSALRQGGHRVPAYDELSWIVGPPLRRNFAALLSEASDVEAGIAAYRKDYAAGRMFEAAVYDGIVDVLKALKAEGARLFVCTAKSVVFARQIVDHFELGSFFEGIYGSELDGRFEDKADLIAHMMEVEGFEALGAIMIGDRDNDTKSAGRNNIASIGALWGFGDADELMQGGASVLCRAPDELLKCIVDLRAVDGAAVT
jgi:phosphoglycolate phosphatase